MTDLAYLWQPAEDWHATSYGDVGVAVGLAAGVVHLNFRSESVGQALNFLMLGAGVGLDASLEGRIGNILDAVGRLLGLGGGLSGYTRINCLRPFSFADLSGAQCITRNFSATVLIGSQRLLLTLRASGIGPAGDGLLFEDLDLGGSTAGLGATATATGNFLISFGTDIYRLNTQRRFERELQRRPSDPVLRDPGMI